MARHSGGGDGTELHLVATDEPGLVLHQPRRKLIQIVVLFAVAIVTCSAAAAYVGAAIAYHRASDHTDARFAELETDLTERRRVAAEGNAKRDAQQAEVAALVCLVLDRIQPRDAQVEAARSRYGCTANPKQPAAGRAPGAGSGGGVPAPAPLAGAAPRPATPAPPAVVPPRPVTPGVPAPVPTQSAPRPPQPLVCAPILGCLGIL